MMMTDDFESDLKELSSAEDFLDYFGISYDLRIVQVNRLHILQRFHDYLNDYDEMPDADAPALRPPRPTPGPRPIRTS
jgi:nitrogenase-stabilizing/protective protein